jgi:hypothetical protein
MFQNSGEIKNVLPEMPPFAWRGASTALLALAATVTPAAAARRSMPV